MASIAPHSYAARFPVGRGRTSAKTLALASLAFQHVSIVLMIRLSRVRAWEVEENGRIPYIVSTVVVASEILKICLNLVLERILIWNPKSQKKDDGDGDGLGTGFHTHLVREIISPETIRLFVPGVLYVVQNNIMFVALDTLPVPLYQVMNQGKLLATVLYSRLLLGRTSSWSQYGVLVLLTGGVAIAQFSVIGDSSGGLGLVIMAASSLTSGFAGVYFEKLVKEQNSNGARSVSVPVRNIQLALWGVLIGIIPILMGKELVVIREHGFFAGYSSLVWGVVVNQAIGGLLVSLVLKYADTFLKLVATSLAIVVATPISILVFGDRVDSTFILGMVFVTTAGVIYNKQSSQGMRLSLAKQRFFFFLLFISAVIIAQSYPFLFSSNDLDNEVRNPTKTRQGGIIQQGSTLMSQNTVHQKMVSSIQENKDVHQLRTPVSVTPATNTSNTKSAAEDACMDLIIKARIQAPKSKSDKWEKKNWGEATIAQKESWANLDCVIVLSLYEIKELSYDDVLSPGVYSSVLKAPQQQLLFKMTKVLMEHLKSRNVRYFPAFGSLLGIARNRVAILPWDDDMDFQMQDDGNLKQKLTAGLKRTKANTWELPGGFVLFFKTWGMPWKVHAPGRGYPTIDMNTFKVQGKMGQERWVTPEKELANGHIHKFDKPAEWFGNMSRTMTVPYSADVPDLLTFPIPDDIYAVVVDDYGKKALTSCQTSYNHNNFCRSWVGVVVNCENSMANHLAKLIFPCVLLPARYHGSSLVNETNYKGGILES